MWPYIIAAAASVISGMQASNAANANARSNSIANHYNARMTLETGIANSNAITALARSNNMLTAALSQLNADDNWDIANYNADLRMAVGDYNARLLEQEALDVWEAAELDVTQIDNHGKRLAGNILASYGASGAQINDTDSVADALIDAKTQVELEKFIIRHGADIRATAIQNEAARNRWDGYMSAKQIIYEGSKASMNTLARGAASMIGTGMQAGIDAAATYENAVRSMKSISMGGEAVTSQYNAQASQAMASGLFQAAGQMASGAVKNAGASAGTTTASPKIREASSYNQFSSINSGSLITTNGNYSASLLTE